MRRWRRGGGLAAAPALAAGGPGALKGYADVDPALFMEINRVREAGKKSALEKKHAPLIEVPGKIQAGVPFAVTVTVGEIVHPMSSAHYIGYVELLAGNEPAGRIDFNPETSVPKATFHLALERPVTLVARAYCNLHGLWESRLELPLS